MKKLVRFEVVAEIETDCEDESLVETMMLVAAKELGKTVSADDETIEWDASNIPGYVDDGGADPLPMYTLKVDVVSSEVKVLTEGVA